MKTETHDAYKAFAESLIVQRGKLLDVIYASMAAMRESAKQHMVSGDPGHARILRHAINLCEETIAPIQKAMSE